MLRFLISILFFFAPLIYCVHGEPHEFESTETTGSWVPGAIIVALYIVCAAALIAIVVYGLVAYVLLALILILAIYAVCIVSGIIIEELLMPILGMALNKTSKKVLLIEIRFLPIIIL